jgi:hypothetical protein
VIGALRSASFRNRANGARAPFRIFGSSSGRLTRFASAATLGISTVSPPGEGGRKGPGEGRAAERPTCGASRRAAARLATRRRASPHCGGSRHTAARLAALRRLSPHGGAPRRSCNVSRRTAACLAAVATSPAARRRLSPPCEVSRRPRGVSRRSGADRAGGCRAPASARQASGEWLAFAVQVATGAVTFAAPRSSD